MSVYPCPDFVECELDVVVRSAINKKIQHGTLNFTYVEIGGVKSLILHKLFIKIDLQGFDPHQYITVDEFRNLVDDLDPKFSQKILDQLQIDRVWIKQGKTI